MPITVIKGVRGEGGGDEKMGVALPSSRLFATLDTVLSSSEKPATKKNCTDVLVKIYSNHNIVRNYQAHLIKKKILVFLVN